MNFTCSIIREKPNLYFIFPNFFRYADKNILSEVKFVTGWYDRKEIGLFRWIEDVNVIAAMAPPGGGRNPVTARLLRHFHTLAFPDMEDDAKVSTKFKK